MSLATGGLSFAADAAKDKRNYDIPGSAAEAAIKRFSDQTGVEVLYPSDVTEGVQTRPVRGLMTAKEALEQMLSGTGIIVIHDRETGAISLRRHVSAGSRRTTAALGETNRAPGDAGTEPRPRAAATGTISGRVENSATGQYLNNARVSVRGTSIVAFTDQFGLYRIVTAPEGPQVLEVFYTDLDPQEIRLEVPGGGNIEQNVSLTSVARYGKDAGIVRLNPFLVSTDKDTDAQSIAINEQRFSPNIKNVMAADELGDVLGSSVGEFLKFVPGLTVEQEYLEITGVSIRGLGSDMTSVTTDGVAEPALYTTATRGTDIRSMALNDISRIEVTKVPTPSTPADSLAGSVNMISKSAFERSGQLLRYGINLLANSENLTFKKTPHPYLDRSNYKIVPGASFDYTLPLTKDFGIVLTGMYNVTSTELHYARKIWAGTGTGTGASVAQPYLQQFQLNDGPTILMRRTLSFKADWRVTPNSVLSYSNRINRGKTQVAGMAWLFTTGTNGTPTPASGVRMSYGPDFTIGATGRGSVTMRGGSQLVNQSTDINNLNWRFDNGNWKLDLGFGHSIGVTRRRNAVGEFGTVTVATRNPVRVSYLDIVDDIPRDIQAFDASNRPVDIYDIDSYAWSTANSVAPMKNKKTYTTGTINARKRVDAWRIPGYLQAGGFQRVETLDMRLASSPYSFNGGSQASVAPYQTQVYKNVDSHYGFRNIPWGTPSRAAQAALDNPGLFSQTPAQVVSAETYRMTNSESIRETVTAFYLQAEASFVGNRLRLLTGVRYENTEDEGRGLLNDPNAVFVKNADGTFAHDAAGNRIRKTEAGAAGSMEQLRLTHRERASLTEKNYDGYYPSFHLNYDFSENLLVRAAYARTYGRPNFQHIIPRTTINEADLDEGALADPSVSRGTLSVRNPALKPWSADNYDLSLEYYSRQGGLFSGGVFLKEIKNFFSSGARMATLEDLREIGFDPRYVGWTLSTTFNAGDARVSGIEFNVRHSLRGLGRWGSYFTLFANYTRLKLEGDQRASFNSFVPEVGNWGASFNAKRLSATVRWNYRGEQQRGAIAGFGADGFEYYMARTTVDMNFSYQITRRISLAASVNNLFNEPQTLLRYGSETPKYAREYQQAEFGVNLAAGIKGTF